MLIGNLGIVMEKKPLIIVIALLGLVGAALFPYELIANKAKHNDFIHFILSKAAVANRDIINQRHLLLQDYHKHSEDKTLSSSENAWLQQLANHYKVKKPDFKNEQTWTTLVQRVDLVPDSLVIAQAINESAWGTSRFATQGNNYFGQWCYTKDCGIVPNQRADGEHFEVRRFSSPLASVQSYMLNLNSNHLYNAFRQRRHLLRLNGEDITGLALVPALEMYSTKRGEYTRIIGNIIKHYNLQDYDHAANMKTSHSVMSWF